MFLKRRIVLDKSGNAVKFNMVLYPDKDAYLKDFEDAFPDLGSVIGSTTCYEKAEKLEMLFNELCE